MSEKIYQLNVVCEPEFSVVCGLLGEGRADKTQIKEIYDAELKHLRCMVKPVALLGQCDTGLFLAVLLSLGRAGVQYVQELFTQGEHLRALVTDAMLSAWLFVAVVSVQADAHSARHLLQELGRLSLSPDILVGLDLEDGV